MPRKRPPRAVWVALREQVWLRDQQQCTRCHTALALEAANIDHIKSGKYGTNELTNLRTLCRRCHVLRTDHRHRGMIANALRDGVIPSDWRSLVWED